MSKVLQVVIYKSISDEEKLSAYAELAGPAMKAAGAKFLARWIPVAVREEGQKTRPVVVEWDSIEAANAGYNSDGYLEALKKLDGSAVVREFYRQEVLAQADEDLSVKKFMDALDIFCDQKEVARVSSKNVLTELKEYAHIVPSKGLIKNKSLRSQI